MARAQLFVYGVFMLALVLLGAAVALLPSTPWKQFDVGAQTVRSDSDDVGVESQQDRFDRLHRKARQRIKDLTEKQIRLPDDSRIKLRSSHASSDDVESEQLIYCDVKTVE
jgi:hypothetical protein